jgi:hypothetical protein
MRAILRLILFCFMFTPASSQGAGVPSTYGDAMRWYEKAAEDGSVQAQNLLGRMFESGTGRARDERAAAGWYRRAAAQGHGGAQFRLGLMYFEGRGVVRDSVAAARWYQMAAMQGHVRAAFNLGYLYDIGAGVLANRDVALGYYRKAAQAGLGEARFNLGILLSTADEADRDSQIGAWAWLALAADQGIANAAAARDAQFTLLSPAERDVAKSRLPAMRGQ